MKNLIYILWVSLAMTGVTASAQQENVRLAYAKEDVRIIEVEGDASAEVQYDEYLLLLGLKAYTKIDTIKIDTLGKKKFKLRYIEFSEVEKAFFTTTSDCGFYNTDIVYQSYNQQYKFPSETSNRQGLYVLKIKDLKKIERLLERLDPKAIDTLSLQATAYSNQNELEKELRIKAVQEAKNKAKRILESLSESLDSPQTIVELPIYVVALSPTNNSYWGDKDYNSFLPQQCQQITHLTINTIKKVKVTARVRIAFEIGD